MVSISPVSFSMFSLSPSVGIGYLGPHTSFNDSTPISALTIPVKQLTNDPYLLSLLSWRARISTFAGREKELAVREYVCLNVKTGSVMGTATEI